MAGRRLLRFLAITVGVGAVLAFAAPDRVAAAPQCESPEVRIFKREAVLELACKGAIARTMPATFGASPIGPKEREGDEKTPEGFYRVVSKTKSERFHRFLAINYPNDADVARAKAMGHDPTRLGGGIGIHGSKRELAGLARLWLRAARVTGASSLWGPTDGCIGITNEDAEFLFETLPVGTRVTIAARR